MTLHQAIGIKLAGEPAITAFTADRIYYGAAPPDKGSYPAINYFEVSSPPIAEGAFERPRVQVSCRAQKPEDARQLAQLVVQTFHLLQETVAGFTIQRAVFDDLRLFFEREAGIHHVPVDLMFVV